MDKIGKKAAKIGASMSRSLTLPIVAIGVASVKTFADFEQGMSDVSTLVDTSTESMDAMSKKVLEIGQRTPVALEDLTSALFDTRSAGVSAADAMGVLERSAQLGVSGLGTTAEAVDLVTSSVNAFGLEGEEAQQVYDNIFKTTKNGKTTISELAQGFGAVAGTVAASGTKLDEYLASVAALTTVGLPAAQAHSQLRGVISALTKDTKETSSVFRQLGAKDLKDLIKQSGGLVPSLVRISDELDGNSTKILKLVGRTEAMNAIIGLTGGQNEAFTDTLADMRSGTDELGTAFEKQNATTASSLKRTKNSMQIAAISIGKVLVPAVEVLTEKLQAASDWWANLDDDTKETIVTIAGVVAVVGPVILIMGKLAIAIGAIGTAIKVVGIALATNPIGIILAGLALVALTIAANWDTLGPVFKTIWDGITGTFEEAQGIILGIIEDIMANVDRVIRAVDDARAHFAGKQTSGEKAEQLAANEAAVARDIARGLTGARTPGQQNALSGDALAEFNFNARRASLGPSALGDMGQGGGTSKIEVVIKSDLPTRVKTTSDERAVDVTTGPQTMGDF